MEENIDVAFVGFCASHVIHCSHTSAIILFVVLFIIKKMLPTMIQKQLILTLFFVIILDEIEHF